MRRWPAATLDVLGDRLPAALLAVIVVVVTADVGGRFLFRSPLRAANEIAVVSLVWLTFLGTIGVARHGGQIGVEYFVSLLPPRPRAIAVGVRDVLVAAVAAGAVYAAYVQITTGRFATLPLTGVPRTWLTAAMLVGMALVALVHLRKAWRAA